MSARLRAASLALGFALVSPADVSYSIRTLAGSDFVGDGGQAASALLFAPECVALDAAGNIYIADPADHRVRKIAPNGIITTVAGNGQAGFAGDGGPAAQAQLDRPYGLAVDASGNLYIADFGNGRVRKVGADGLIRTVAGGGSQGPNGSGHLATAVRLPGPRNLVADLAGNLYISDFLDHRVYRLSPAGRIEPIAGTGAPGLSGNGGPASQAQLNHPAGLAFDRAGNLYIADSGNRRVRLLSGGILRTLNVPLELDLPTGLSFDAAGNLYIADRSRIVKLSPANKAAVLSTPARDVAVDVGGNLYVAAGTPQLLRISSTGSVSLFAGATNEPGFWGDGAPASQARLNSPSGLALAPDGSLYIADTGNFRVRKLSPAGIISTVAGAGSGGTTGEGIPATAIKLLGPTALALESNGNLLVADQPANRVRRITPLGTITTAAGTGTAGYNGEGAATAIQLNMPGGLATDASGNVYIADTANHRIRKLTPDGYLITIAGCGLRGYAGDGGAAIDALLDSPAGLALDRNGSLYVADRLNHAVRKITREGLIITVAGSGLAGFSGDGGPATQARLNRPMAVAVDGEGNLYIADTENHRVRKVSPEGIITTIAGTGLPGFEGDDGPALVARLRFPSALAVDAAGNVYVADQGNHRVRLLSPTWEPVAAAMETLTIVNAASMLPGPIAPGQIVSILGSRLGPQAEASAKLDESGSLPRRLNDVEVLWDGKPGPLLYASGAQLNAQVPYAVASQKETQIEVRYKGRPVATQTVSVAEAAPALFTLEGGRGQAAALNEDGTLNSPSNPAARGSIITLFATGEGLLAPLGQEGRPAGPPWPKPVLPVSLTIGVHPAEILFCGSAPGLVGVLQINARVPGGFAPAGQLPVELTVGRARSQPGVTVAIR